MKVSGRHVFRSDRETVWKRLQDPEVLAATLPGVRRLEVTGPDRYAVAADVGVGSVKGIYQGTVSLEDKRDFEGCTLVGSGRGAAGSIQVTARAELADDGSGGTALDYEADAMVTGAVASVGSRMIQAAGRKMAAQFFGALDAYDERAVAAVPAGEAPAVGRVFERPAAEAGSSKAFVAGLVAGFVLAVIGILIGRATAPRGHR